MDDDELRTLELERRITFDSRALIPNRAALFPMMACEASLLVHGIAPLAPLIRVKGAPLVKRTLCRFEISFSINPSCMDMVGVSPLPICWNNGPSSLLARSVRSVICGGYVCVTWRIRRISSRDLFGIVMSFE